jgi:hypothetical protein
MKLEKASKVKPDSKNKDLDEQGLEIEKRSKKFFLKYI